MSVKEERKMNRKLFKLEEVEWVEVAQNSAKCKVFCEGSNNSLTAREGKNILKELSY
jgi:hypothetical protein